MSKAVIEVSGLHKVYEGAVPVKAVNGIDLTITEGEFTALKGPSGCGKTTLLNLLGGLDQPTSGSILIDGTDITALSDNELIDFRLHNIGFVFQAYNLIPVLSATENVSFIMLLQDRPKEERLARALASKPKFVLADEPTANLDSESTSKLLDIMEQLNAQENMTFVFATHDDRVIAKAKRVVSISDGKVISDTAK